MWSKIKIKVTDINVNDKDFSFKYKIKVDGELRENKGVYNSSHVWDDKLGFSIYLRKGYATRLVVEEILPDYL